MDSGDSQETRASAVTIDVIVVLVRNLLKRCKQRNGLPQYPPAGGDFPVRSVGYSGLVLERPSMKRDGVCRSRGGRCLR